MTDLKFKEVIKTEQGQYETYDKYLKKHYKKIANGDCDLEQELFIKFIESVRSHDFTNSCRNNYIKFYKVVAKYWKNQYYSQYKTVVPKHYRQHIKKILSKKQQDWTTEESNAIVKYNSLKDIKQIENYDSVMDIINSEQIETKYVNEIDFKTYFSKLNKLEQDILKLRLEGFTITEIACMLKVCNSKVQRILKKIICELCDI